MKRIRVPASLAAAALVVAGFMAGLAASPSLSGAQAPAPPFQAQPFRVHVDLRTFMEHVLQPAAGIVWSVNATIIDGKGEHDLSPRTDDDWERIVSGAATLAEATNALMIPERVRDAEWNGYARKLADAAGKAYRAAEAHDLKSVTEVSDALDGICAACHRHYGVE
jgi:hypothetical protein